MKHKLLLLAILGTLGSSFHTAPVQAQSDLLLRLRSGSPVGDRVRIDSAGGFVAMGQLGFGIIPASGWGERMMWHPFRGAFRAGGVQSAGGNFWDDANVGFYSWAGGNNTRASGNFSFAFGLDSEARAVCSVAMGQGSIVHAASPNFGNCGFAMGLNSEVYRLAGVAMGQQAVSQGDRAIAIGHRVTADANHSVALGRYASTDGREGAIVIGDGSTTTTMNATANHQFSVRAAGGIRFFSNAAMTLGVSLAASGNSWNTISDINRKEGFEQIDGEDLLHRLRSVPVTRWNYIEEGAHVRHIGPMAQDWHHAFQLNDDALTINMSDIDGVNLAGVQALERRTSELRHENAELRSELDSLKATQAELVARIERLEASVQALASQGSR